MRFQTILLFIVSPFLGISQKEATIWNFADKGRLDFSTSPPTVEMTSSINAIEGCASICSPTTGKLLFYTDGETVWNSLDSIMQNGRGLDGYISSKQSSVIVPHPCDTNIFYVFTSDGSTSDPTTGRSGFSKDSVFSYSKVNMGIDNGLGAVTKKNVKLFSPVNENLAAVKHANGIDTWVLAKKYRSNKYYAYLVTENGVDKNPVVSTSGAVDNYPSLTPIRFSGDGKWLAVGFPTLRVYPFDNNSGKLIDQGIDFKFQGFGFGFSPDGTKLYTSCNRKYCFQYDLTDVDTSAPKPDTVFVARNGGISFSNVYFQNAIDDKMYVFDSGSGVKWKSIAIIDKPNLKGSACLFDFEGIKLDTFNQGGLPSYIESYFNENWVSRRWKELRAEIESDTIICIEDTLKLKNATQASHTRVSWDFGDGSYSNSFQSAYHVYTTTGVYKVDLNVGYCSYKDAVSRFITVQPCDEVVIEMPNVFTPNGDGVNDEFLPIEIKGVDSYQLSIFNRWGQLVFESNSTTHGWNGKDKGRNCLDGVYYWVVSYSNDDVINNVKKGFLTLSR